MYYNVYNCGEQKNVNNKAQSGTVQRIMIGLIVVAAVSVLALNYISGIGINYGVAINESEYEIFSATQGITNVTEQMTDSFVSDTGEQTSADNIIDLMVTNGYGMIKLFFMIPSLINDLASAAAQAIGVPPIMVWAVFSIITIMILYAAYEAIMKVRS